MSRSRKEGSASESRSTADEVRKSFAELPFEQRISTLIKVELDMVGDAVENIVNAVSSAIDDLAKACDFKDEQGPATSASGQASAV
ncbi:MAG TPA: hypothetical protein VKN18_17890 [Blastocatellia bacterium]|nr:hypothetical protein [Blastocatellia bacterium]